MKRRTWSPLLVKHMLTFADWLSFFCTLVLVGSEKLPTWYFSSLDTVRTINTTLATILALNPWSLLRLWKKAWVRGLDISLLAGLYGKVGWLELPLPLCFLQPCHTPTFLHPRPSVRPLHSSTINCYCMQLPGVVSVMYLPCAQLILLCLAVPIPQRIL